MMHYVSNHINNKLRAEKKLAPEISPWQKLANAIVEQAVKDYRTAHTEINFQTANKEQEDPGGNPA